MPDNQNSSEWEPRPMASDVEKRIAKALLSARSHIGSCRPDYDEDDAAWWDELTELAELVTQPAASGEASPQQHPDSVRLDYIERKFSGCTNRERYLPVQMIWGTGCNGRTLREACDKYMKRDAAIDAAITGEKL